MNEIVKPGIILFAICIIASFCLGLVNQITKTPIETQRQETKLSTQKELLPEATEFEEIQFTSENSVSEIYKAMNSGETVGYIFFAKPRGYGDVIEVAVALSSKGNILDIRIVNQNETPGLGTNVTNPSFLEQYKISSGPFVVTKMDSSNQNEITAITSATISSEAVTLGVNDILETFKSVY